ncbi:MAG: methionine gamma-lyase family protein [Clostridia bacterium]|nr:methionine gamma-lyase family protein [Clostridia bacterium]
MSFSKRISDIAEKADRDLQEVFRVIDRISEYNTSRVLTEFKNSKVSDSLFAGTTGYGYDDKGRDVLDRIFAKLFGAESAFVRHNIVSGTHALTIALFGLLRPGDIMLSVTGKPYDTLDGVIGSSDGNGSLKDYGIEYRETDVLTEKGIDCSGLAEKISSLSERLKVVYIQRSRGYLSRKTLSTDDLAALIKNIRSVTDAFIVVDNCYGEFVDTCEPTQYGADLAVGSLIKNPGGGLADSGGYIAGSARAVELASYRLTSVGAGCEVGASLGQNRNLYRGLFYAPHTVAQALKTAHFAAYVFSELGFETDPQPYERRYDIIQTVKLGSPEKLCAFCAGIQHGSPVDSFVTPVAWDMPGYKDQVIMAAGTFTQGASIELSADGPMRPPYTVFFQGGLTYESGKYCIMSAADELIRCT